MLTFTRDGFWNAIAQWFGVNESFELDEVLPNRNTFSNDLLKGSDLFNMVDNPTIPPAASPTPSPTEQPTTPSPTSPTPVTPAPTPLTPCSEDPNSKFFFRKKKSIVQKRSCSWLESQSDVRKGKVCGNKTKYYTNASGTVFPPPQIACPNTCENYCNPCFENPKTRYSHAKKKNGTYVFKTCVDLSGKSQAKIDTICSRTKSYQDYPIPSVACPVTCSQSECGQDSENS